MTNEEYEKNIILREANQIETSDNYFDARPNLDNEIARKVFEAAFTRGWQASFLCYSWHLTEQKFADEDLPPPPPSPEFPPNRIIREDKEC
jgi:hypothetical protein